jgi:nitrate/nitrite-specific signal transduction histidine kinase
MAMHKRHALSTKLVTIGSVLLVVALLSIGLTLWVTWQLEGGAAAVNEAGRIAEAASVKDEKDLYQAQLDIFLNPNDPAVIEQARKDGIP